MVLFQHPIFQLFPTNARASLCLFSTTPEVTLLQNLDPQGTPGSNFTVVFMKIKFAFEI
jgi:hypothetical protein